MKTNTAEDQDTVEAVAELNDEDLAKDLEEAMKPNADESEESDDKGGEKDPEKDEEKSDDDEEEDSEKSDDDEDKGDEEEETPEEALKRELEEARADNAKIKEQLEEKENFAQRKANDEGKLRKELDALKVKRTEVEEEELRTRHQADPVETTQEMIDASLAAKETDAEKQVQAQMLHTESTKRAVEKEIPGFLEMVGEVAEMAAQDGAKAEAVAAFKADPYGSSDAPYLLNYAKRILIAKELKEAQEKISTLKTEADPDDVAKKIQEAANKKPALKKKSSSTREKDGDNLTREDVANMSDEELEELLKGSK